MGVAAAGAQSNGLDISPKYISIIWGISNTFATIPGIVGNFLTGYILQVLIFQHY
jgi:ACS family sodium-dependent inorganic phosphate cotransporter